MIKPNSSIVQLDNGQEHRQGLFKKIFLFMEQKLLTSQTFSQKKKSHLWSNNYNSDPQIQIILGVLLFT